MSGACCSLLEAREYFRLTRTLDTGSKRSAGENNAITSMLLSDNIGVNKSIRMRWGEKRYERYNLEDT